MPSLSRPMLAILLLVLSGCGALSALDDASQPLDIYQLQPVTVSGAVPRSGAELVIEEPVAGGVLETDRIMIQTGPFQAQYLPGVRWSDPAPAMLQTLLLRSFAETGALGSVGRNPIAARPDFALLGELTDFQAETVEGVEGATVRTRIMLRIVREEDARVVASRTFETTEPSVSTETEALVPAFDRAASRLVTEIVPWVLGQVAR